MRTLLAAALVAITGCAGATSDPAPTTESAEGLGLEVTEMSDARVQGSFKTAHGDVRFISEITDNVLHVTFDRGRTVMRSDYAFATMTNDMTMTPGTEVNAEDRFLMIALATIVENELGRDGKALDGLFRHATLWGSHPAGKLVRPHFVVDPNRSWTKLCSVGACSSGSRTFYHDGIGHGWSGWYLGFGKYSGTNCRARCGAGCASVGTSAWTQDCGNHDHCESHHSDFGASCSDQFASASDDYVAAANCGC